MKRIVYLFLLFPVLFASCAGSEQQDQEVMFEHFSIQEEPLNWEKVFTNKYEITPLETTPDCLVGMIYKIKKLSGHYYIASGKNIFHFDERGKFVAALDKQGQGPEEYIAPALVQNGKGNCLSVFEQASFKMRKFEFGEESAVMSEEYGIELEDPRPWQEIYYRNDSILVFSTLDNEIKTYNLNSHGVADTYRFHSDLEDRMGGNYNQLFDSFHFSCEQERLFIAFHFNNLIVQGSVDDAGKIAISDTEIRYNHPLNETLFDNRYYYMYVTSTADLNFAQYAGYSFRRLQPFPLNMGKRKFDMLLEVYSSTGRPLAVLDLQHDILRCKVDGVRKRIFTWNTLEDFDHLFVYDYSGLDFDRN